MQRQRLPSNQLNGLTLVEVMIASVVLLLVIISSISTLQVGFQMVDTSRGTNLATQILQSGMENHRGLHWVDIKALPTTWTNWSKVNVLPEFSSAPNSFEQRMKTEEITAEILSLQMQVRWTGLGGTSHIRTFSNLFAKEGLSDYYYTK